MILETRHQSWPDEAACAASGATLAACPGLGDAFIELRGPLGAGKTTFVRHLLAALGVRGRVKSPTYAVLESYEVQPARDPAQFAGSASVGGAPGDAHRLQIHHFDFYRFDYPREWEDAGFREVFAGPGLKLAEWPDKAAGLLPIADLQLFIDPVDGEGTDRHADVDVDVDVGAGPGAVPDTDSPSRAVRFVAHTDIGRRLLPPAAAPLATA